MLGTRWEYVIFNRKYETSEISFSRLFFFPAVDPIRIVCSGSKACFHYANTVNIREARGVSISALLFISLVLCIFVSFPPLLLISRYCLLALSQFFALFLSLFFRCASLSLTRYLGFLRFSHLFALSHHFILYLSPFRPSSLIHPYHPSSLLHFHSFPFHSISFVRLFVS